MSRTVLTRPEFWFLVVVVVLALVWGFTMPATGGRP